ncbi:MAG: asparaginase [Salaquimonas sp.]
MKSNPAAIIEVTRGNATTQYLESLHAVDIIVADASGKIVETWGDGERAVFPRSANKALQALLLVESGAADAYGFAARHLALACSSHNGEVMHTDTAREMLAKAGLEETCLECGAQLPFLAHDVQSLAEQGIPVSAIHNNCSGKHSGFVSLAKYQGLAIKDYVKFDHPLQKQIAGVLESVTGAKHGADNYGIDGCSIPTYEIPMKNLAIAYARFGAGEDGSTSRSKAMIRLRDACMAHPEIVAGSQRFDTELMAALGTRAFVKTGAEGVFTIAVPETGMGAVLKCRDGTTRAAEVACARIVESILQKSDSGLSETETRALKRLTNPDLKNWNKIKVGEIRWAI